MNLKESGLVLVGMLVMGIIYLISEAIADVIYKYLHIRSGAIIFLIFFGLCTLAYYHVKEYSKRKNR